MWVLTVYLKKTDFCKVSRVFYGFLSGVPRFFPCFHVFAAMGLRQWAAEVLLEPAEGLSGNGATH